MTSSPLSADQVVHGRSARETPEGDHRVADGAPQRRMLRERDYRVAVEVVQRVPGGVQEPRDAYESVGPQPPVGEVGDHGGEGELPHAEASPAQVGCAGARYEDGVELPPGGLLEQRTQRNVH